MKLLPVPFRFHPFLLAVGSFRSLRGLGFQVFHLLGQAIGTSRATDVEATDTQPVTLEMLEKKTQQHWKQPGEQLMMMMMMMMMIIIIIIIIMIIIVIMICHHLLIIKFKLLHGSHLKLQETSSKNDSPPTRKASRLSSRWASALRAP